ncbi:hypothetical protein KUTeg_018724 [Tegillarca granosa]|uniref:Protein C10 n=1 Tax=Tegillarca granosa TaxID=220873 RepID=A0ABQ9EEN4_TEGGR|nr:hypothetical protein KUTeg_018724 [Tegillarca granosa]
MLNMATSLQHFSIQDCKAALSDVLTAFRQPANAKKLDEAKDNAGNDMLRSMQIVFPIATQIQMEIIEKYGFPPDGDGIIRFTQAVKIYEKQDPEVAHLSNEVRTVLMPGVYIMREGNLAT